MTSSLICRGATYVKCRDSGHMSSAALVMAISAGSDGYRRMLGMDAIDTCLYSIVLAQTSHCDMSSARIRN